MVLSCCFLLVIEEGRIFGLKEEYGANEVERVLALSNFNILTSDHAVCSTSIFPGTWSLSDGALFWKFLEGNHLKLEEKLFNILSGICK